MEANKDTAKSGEIELLYSDRDIAVCVKRAGMLSEGESEDSVPLLLEKAFGREVYTVHRLDRETAGVIVYAKSSEAAASLSAQIVDGTFKKEYLAVTCGIPEEKEGEIRSLLFYDRGARKTFCVKRKRQGVKEARLSYKVLGEAEGMALLKVRLYTGRTHQIRAQFSSIGFPLLGDRRYGAPKSGYSGIALAAKSLSFIHPKIGNEMSFSYSPDKGEYPWSLFEGKISE